MDGLRVAYIQSVGLGCLSGNDIEHLRIAHMQFMGGGRLPPTNQQPKSKVRFLMFVVSVVVIIDVYGYASFYRTLEFGANGM